MKKNTPPKKDSLLNLLKPYIGLIFGLILFTVLSNGLNLVIPKIISTTIDNYTKGTYDMVTTIVEFFIVSLSIFVFTYLQNIIQVYTAEKVARNLRTQLIEKISRQDYNYIQHITPSKILTNITSDVDGVKGFVSQSISSLISSIFLIIGASTLLLLINWKLALSVMIVLPIIGGVFAFIFSKVRVLFKLTQEAIDTLNKIISESIVGSALIRLLNSQTFEYQKFLAANLKAKEISLRILGMFATLMPIITLCTNFATLIILVL